MSAEPRDAGPGQSARHDVAEAGVAIFEAAKDRIAHLVSLAAAELRLAAMSGVSILLMLVMAVAALLFTWGLIIAMAVHVLGAVGVAWPYSGLLLALLHVLLAYLLFRTMLKLSRNLTLPELRQALSKHDPRRF